MQTLNRRCFLVYLLWNKSAQNLARLRFSFDRGHVLTIGNASDNNCDSFFFNSPIISFKPYSKTVKQVFLSPF